MSQTIKRGRPSKNYVDLHCQIPEDIKTKIDQLSTVLDISQGEFISVAVREWLKNTIRIED